MSGDFAETCFNSSIVCGFCTQRALVGCHNDVTLAAISANRKQQTHSRRRVGSSDARNQEMSDDNIPTQTCIDEVKGKGIHLFV